MQSRPRRNRQSQSIRSLVQETTLNPSDFVLPLFITEGTDIQEPIQSMPGISRYSVDMAIKRAKEAYKLGIKGIALFPKLKEELKDSYATHSYDLNNLNCIALREIKKHLPHMLLFSDVAMDPYSSDGHDGIVKDGEILNDETLVVLAKMAVAQAKSGTDFVAPSDMMDGRVAYIRDALDQAGFKNVGILSYTAKYASSFYGPFRDALDSAPKAGDKKTYQMDYANSKEALRELFLDEAEGADIVMVKPALSYLDIIKSLKENTTLPVAAYFVSGEYSMIMAAGEKGWLDSNKVMLEALTSIKRAGADIIFTYNAIEIASELKNI